VGNRLTGLPPEIGNLTELRALYIGANKLTSLPPEIGNLTGLQALYLQENALTDVPSEIRNLSQLRTLNLSANRLTSVPPAIEQLTGLQALYLHDNQLKQIPLNLIIYNRTYIYLSGNPLDHVPASVNDQGNDAIRAYLRQPDPHLITGGFWMTVIATLLTLVVGAWGLIRVWARRADRHPRIVMAESPGRG
jgi:Leucine-rich repeat (LRR) protein